MIFEISKTNPQASVKSEVFRALAAALHHRSIKEALTWADSLRDKPIAQTAALQGIINQLDCTGELRAFIESAPPGEAWASAWRALIQRTAENDPAEASTE